jgi:hypothetical protein
VAAGVAMAVGGVRLLLLTTALVSQRSLPLSLLACNISHGLAKSPGDECEKQKDQQSGSLRESE